jgi:hypothetical protein
VDRTPRTRCRASEEAALLYGEAANEGGLVLILWLALPLLLLNGLLQH